MDLSLKSQKKSNFEVSVFYDGACPLCSREIDIYKRKDTFHRIEFIDIAAESFVAADFGFDTNEVRLFLHVKNNRTNQVFKGIDSFIEIWKFLPGFNYKVLKTIVSIPPIKISLRPCYFVFARFIRPRLPKRKSDCDSGSCSR